MESLEDDRITVCDMGNKLSVKLLYNDEKNGFEKLSISYEE